MLSSGYGHHARSHGTLREYEFRRVRLEPREALTHAKEQSAGLSLCSRGVAGSAGVLLAVRPVSKLANRVDVVMFESF